MNVERSIEASRGSTEHAVHGETDRLTDVLLCRPTFLEAVPCCSATRESIGGGFAVSRSDAARQHLALEKAIESRGVRVHHLAPRPGAPDLCFTRDAALMTPWGLLGLRPAAPHRAQETGHVLSLAQEADITILGTLEAGTVEGGDVSIVRDGLVIVGYSGERTSARGAEALCELFGAAGWATVRYRFDPHFLHLDTQFCMVSENLALACVDVLRDDFIAEVEGLGIELIPVSYKEAQRLGCNLLSLGNRRLIASSSHPRISSELQRRGFAVDLVDISQFEHCGGGVHCLTLPLARRTA